MTRAVAHAPMTQFPVVDGALHVGGMPLARLAERVGRTPFYAYDRQAIAQRVALCATSAGGVLCITR
jgi:diaminopimelate decarboxylase